MILESVDDEWDVCVVPWQLSDCHRGVVMDGLETLYSLSPSSTLQIILKAFNNRSFIYMVNLSNNYYAFKAKERAQREAEGEDKLGQRSWELC